MNPRQKMKIPGIRTVLLMLMGNLLSIVACYGQQVYWLNYPGGSNYVQRANIDGTNVQDIALGFSAAFTRFAIDVDPVGKHVFFTSTTRDTSFNLDRGITRTNLDGSNPVDIVPLLGGAEFDPTGLAVDSVNGHVYWSDGDEIKRSDTNGAGIVTILSGLTDTQHLDLDVGGGKMYWTTASGLFRANLDGTFIDNLATAGVGEVYRGVTVEPVGGYVFWSEENTNRIFRANLNGSSPQTVLTSPTIDFPRGIDAQNSVGLAMVYGGSFANPASLGAVATSALDGTGHQVIVSTGNYLDIAILVPEPAGVLMSILAVVGLVSATHVRGTGTGS